MLNHLNNMTARIGGTNELVDGWLHARKQLLVSWYNLVGLKPGKEARLSFDPATLEQFCHTLVDYLSACHFKIYEQVMNEPVNNSPFFATTQIYPLLQQNTHQLMSYHDVYLSNPEGREQALSFQQVLSDITETLAARFALEDQLIMLAYSNNLGVSAEAANEFRRPA